MPSVDPTHPFPADCAERFTPIRPLARGGFSEVWLARQISLGRPAAIKIVRHDHRGDAEYLARFLEEARINASVAHPNVVVVYDHGAGAGVPWIAYESLSGRTLRDRIGEGPMPWRAACRIAGQIASALEEAHSRGILHRDIKPDNVLEARVDHYKLADFGIAIWLDGTVTRTESGVIVGTPAYLAPERIKMEPATAAADLYAMGAVLFEMLTARRPFESKQPLEVMRAHLEILPVPPSSLQPGIPPAVDDLVIRLLSKFPPCRPASARHLVEELSALVGDAGRDSRDHDGGLDDSRPITAVIGGHGGERIESHSATPARSPGRFWAGTGLALAVAAMVFHSTTRPSVKTIPSAAASAPSSSATLLRFRADLAKFNDAADKVWARIESRFDLRRNDLEGSAVANAHTAGELSTALQVVRDLDVRCDSLVAAGDVDRSDYRIIKLELATHRFCLWASREQYRQRAAALAKVGTEGADDVASMMLGGATLKARYSLEGLPYLEGHLTLLVPALKEALTRPQSNAEEIRRYLSWGIGAASAFRMVAPEESAAKVFRQTVQKHLQSLDTLPAPQSIICNYLRDLWAWVLREGGVSRERLRQRANQLDLFLEIPPDLRQWMDRLTIGPGRPTVGR